MKKPKTAPAPTPLEMAQEITALHAAFRATPITGGGPEWEAMEEMLMQHGPTICAAYVSLHAHNVAPVGATALTVGEMEGYQALRDDVRRKLRNNTDAQVTAARWFRLADVLDEADATHRAYVSLYARNLELTGDPFGKQLTEAEARNQRLTDLVRHCRAELHEDGLITNEEYAALCADSGAVARLEGYDALRERVEALEAAQRWVPATERLPEIGAVAILRTIDNMFPDEPRYEVGGYVPHPADAPVQPGHWYAFGGCIDFCEVTHWQPLPTAPTEKGGEAE